jgi:ligand-binding sensor domain-containing protein/two-component sensor histidine kinase
MSIHDASPLLPAVRKALLRRLRLYSFFGLFLPVFALAERLPLQRFATADGLPNNSVHRIVRDSRGFVWLCTSEGLARYDGYKFFNYGPDEGLPHRDVHDLLETRAGRYWVATADGVCEFLISTQPQTAGEPLRSKFITFRPVDHPRARWVNTFLEEPGGSILCGTDVGLYRFVPPLSLTEPAKARQEPGSAGQFTKIDFGGPKKPGINRVVSALLFDHRGNLWVASGTGLYCRRTDQSWQRYALADGLPSEAVLSLLEDSAHTLWVGTEGGLGRLVKEPAAGDRVVEKVYRQRDGLAGDYVSSLVSVREQLWVGTLTGLCRIELQKSSAPLHTYQEGVAGLSIESMLKDADENIWLGTDGAGAVKIALNGFSSFSVEDGLHSNSIVSIFEDQLGALCVISRQQESLFLNRLAGNRFHAIRLNLPRNVSSLGWGWNHILVQSREQDWWMATGEGIAWFPQVTQLEQLARISPRLIRVPVLPDSSGSIFRLFQDSHGDLWLSSNSTNVPAGLIHWQRKANRFTACSEAEGLQWRREQEAASAFAEDRQGNLWVGFLSGGLARLRAGRFQNFSKLDGAPDSGIRALHVDRAGRLWAGSGQQGVWRVDNPSSPRPTFTPITRAQGLSSNLALCLTDDRLGRIYIGTSSGVDRLDPTSGKIKNYTPADGLVRGEIRTVYCDQRGSVWFGGAEGLSRLEPQADPPSRPPAIHISSLQVAGKLQPFSELGESTIENLVIGSQQNHLSINFVSPSYALGERLRYQYQLAGSGQGWSELSEQRQINFASLRPGRYQFQVRAVNSAGLASPSPALVGFTILPPVWQRWWFLSGCALVLTWAWWAGHRYRVARLLELERVRTRIAADLHDDIGSNLSQISLLSEVARQRSQDPGVLQPLSQIAETSRELVDSMGDIVWAINPRQDKLSDLNHRIRRFASQLLAARNIDCQFQFPDTAHELTLDTSARQQIYLIVKEALNNLVRHARCTQAKVLLSVDVRHLSVQVKDNGQGFDPTGVQEGNGLKSMLQRARSLSGDLNVTSGPTGTEIHLRVPLKRRHS